MRWMPKGITKSLFWISTTRSKEGLFSLPRLSWPLSPLLCRIYDIDAQVQKFLMELVSRHEGRLTAEIFKSLRKLASA